MGIDFYACLEHYNTKTNKWEALQLYKKDKNTMKKIFFMECCWGEDVEILNDSNSYPKIEGITSLPTNLSKEVQVEINKLYDKKDLLPYYTTPYCINVSNIKIYTLKYPTVNDVYEEWPTDPSVTPPQTENPFNWMLKKISFYLDAFEILEQDYSNLRLIYWGEL